MSHTIYAANGKVSHIHCACVTRIIQRPLSAVPTRVNVAKRNITTGLFGLAHVLMRLYRMDNSLVC